MDAFAGAVGVSDSDGKCTPVYSICEPQRNADAEYFAMVIQQMARTLWIMALSRGIRERSTDFRYESFASQSLPVPPVDEQVSIVRFLKHIDNRIRRVIHSNRRLYGSHGGLKSATSASAMPGGLVGEYRTRLFAEVVTGKLDVREAARHLPTDMAPINSEVDSLGSDDEDSQDDDPSESLSDATDED